MTQIDETWYVRPPGAKDRTSAGGVVVRRGEDGRVLVALAREKGLDSLVLPKGGVERGEALEEAARREIAEEAGFTDLTLLTDLGTRERLDYNKRRWITTHFFLFATGQSSGKPTDPEHEYESVWVPLDGDLSGLFWPEQRALLAEARETIIAHLTQYERSQP
jgi:8-oxo-dGTP pyrophosphatase MutT (NUDIX family)